MRNGGQQRKTGWHLAGAIGRGFDASLMAQPTEWDKLLRELGLSDHAAVAVLAREQTGPRLKLENWVRNNAYTLFVPEAALDVLGLVGEEFDIWGVDRRRRAFRASRQRWAEQAAAHGVAVAR